MKLGERPISERCAHPARYPDEPRGYTAWFDWAERKAKTHEQKLCPHCNRWAIWEKKP